MKLKSFIILQIVIIALLSCDKDDEIKPKDNCTTENLFQENTTRNFKMGFTTWPYDATIEAVNSTYNFIENNADIYSEHLDNNIPWDAWINNTELPQKFTDEINFKLANKIPNKELLLAISLLNLERNDLVEDFDGTTPSYSTLNDKKIEDAYFKHVDYLVNAFNPNYLNIAIEVNILKLSSNKKWEEYKLLINEVTLRIRNKYPNLKISESITLHGIYDLENPVQKEYLDEIINYVNKMDFVSISFYPFSKGLKSRLDFQSAFDFLHNKINKPIAFVETSHIAETLSIPAYNLTINGDECKQNIYLETLISNAQNHEYEFVIWWCHRDYDALWEIFPDETKDLGRLWRDTGIIDEDGNKRSSFYTWQNIFNKR